MQGGAIIGQHGSWSRAKPSGYRVIFVPLVEGRPPGMPQHLLTGFKEAGEARGRPVGVEFDQRRWLRVADDVGAIIWRVTRAQTWARARTEARKTP